MNDQCDLNWPQFELSKVLPSIEMKIFWVKTWSKYEFPDPCHRIAFEGWRLSQARFTNNFFVEIQNVLFEKPDKKHTIKETISQDEIEWEGNKYWVSISKYWEYVDK